MASKKKPNGANNLSIFKQALSMFRGSVRDFMYKAAFKSDPGITVGEVERQAEKYVQNARIYDPPEWLAASARKFVRNRMRSPTSLPSRPAGLNGYVGHHAAGR